MRPRRILRPVGGCFGLGDGTFPGGRGKRPLARDVKRAAILWRRAAMNRDNGNGRYARPAGASCFEGVV